MRNSVPGSDDIIRHVLPNGIVVLVRENFDAQSVVIDGSFGAGAMFEPADRRGLAGIVAEALMRGTHTRDFHSLHEQLETSGMSLDFNGGRFLTTFQGKALGDDIEALLDIVADALFNPSFPEIHVNLIKSEAITGLKYYDQDTRFRSGKAFQQLVYPPEHIYHHGTSGTVESIGAITRDDVVAFHQQQYGPAHMVIVVVGAVQAQKVVERVESLLGSWENRNQITAFDQPNVPPLSAITHEVITLPGKSQNDIVLGVPGPSRLAEDFQAAYLANNILGVFGMQGRLGQTVREEQGLAYYSYSHLAGGLGPGAWQASAGVNPTNVKRALGSIRAEVERIYNEPVSDQDITDNKTNLIARLPLRLETNGGVAANLLNIERYGLGLNYLREYPAEIEAITKADIQSAVRRYWNPDAFALAVAGPELAESLF